MTLLEKNLSKFEEYTNLQKKIDDCTGVIKALNREDDIELIIKYILSETTPVTMGEGLAAETTRSLSKPLIKLVEAERAELLVEQASIELSGNIGVFEMERSKG